MIHQLIVSFTNLVFSAVLQSAPDVNGPWTDRVTSTSNCPSIHRFEVPVVGEREFFRLKLLDNGIAPTPHRPEVYEQGDQLMLICPPVYMCPDTELDYHWYVDGVKFATTQSSFVLVTPPDALAHIYAVQLHGGWSSYILW